MKTFFAALALAALVGGSAFVTSADAARRSVPEYDQPRARRDSDGSWQCYPYCAGGTLRRTPGTRVAQAGWLVRAQRVAEVCLRIRRVPTS